MTAPTIERYAFGEIVIDGRTYRRDVIVFPDRVFHPWWRVEGHSLAPEDLEEVLHDPPEVLVVGQGKYGRMEVPAETRRRLQEAGIRLIAQPTDAACRSYNRLRGQQKVVAALHLTC